MYLNILSSLQGNWYEIHDDEFIQYHGALIKRLYGQFSLLLMGVVYFKELLEIYITIFICKEFFYRL